MREEKRALKEDEKDEEAAVVDCKKLTGRSCLTYHSQGWVCVSLQSRVLPSHNSHSSHMDLQSMYAMSFFSSSSPEASPFAFHSEQVEPWMDGHNAQVGSP